MQRRPTAVVSRFQFGARIDEVPKDARVRRSMQRRPAAIISGFHVRVGVQKGLNRRRTCGQVQRCSAVPVFSARLRAGLEESLKYDRICVFGCAMQRGLAPAIPLVGHGAGVKALPNHLRASPAPNSKVQRATRIGIRARIQQSLNDHRTVRRDRQPQRFSQPSAKRRCAGIEERLDHLGIRVVTGRHIQRPITVLRSRLGIGARIQEHPNHRRVRVVRGRPQQRCLAPVIAGIRIRSGFEQCLHHRGIRTALGRSMQFGLRPPLHRARGPLHRAPADRRAPSRGCPEQRGWAISSINHRIQCLRTASPGGTIVRVPRSTARPTVANGQAQGSATAPKRE